MSTEIFPAATVIVLRDTEHGLEVLLLRRSKAVAFAGGSWVFPGGRIDPADYQGGDDIERAARQAAIRETLEEAALNINEIDLQYYSHWTAPQGTPKRFATWFYLARVTAEAQVAVDGGEIDQYQWYQPEQALEAFHHKHIQLLPPTFVTLTELARCRSVDEAFAMSLQREVPEYLPKPTIFGDGLCMLYPGDAGYETENNQLEGPRHRFWIMPEGYRYEKTDEGYSVKR